MARRKKGNIVNGWLVIDKPQNMGSTDVVNKTRYWYQAQKNGHTGTLDPFATGVLPIAFGEATKIIPFVTDGEKEYEFVIQWGEETDTDDCDGKVINKSDKTPTKEEILEIIPEFIGKIKQVPPVYSAIKIDGKRAYDLARKGEEIQMPEREIEIYDLVFLEDFPIRQAKLRVRCSKGTYVRTLGKDIAKKLGALGHLVSLRRTKCGKFDLKDTILLENLKNMVHSEEHLKILLPVITALRDIAVLAVTPAEAAKLGNGQGLSPKTEGAKDLIGQKAAAICEDRLVAIVEVGDRKISPLRVFNL